MTIELSVTAHDSHPAATSATSRVVNAGPLRRRTGISSGPAHDVFACACGRVRGALSVVGDDTDIVELSVRELEVALAWVTGGSKKKVGETLFISESTVATHIERVRSKYALAGRPAPDKLQLLIRLIEDGRVQSLRRTRR